MDAVSLETLLSIKIYTASIQAPKDSGSKYSHQTLVRSTVKEFTCV
jgi:hypothetical protein